MAIQRSKSIAEQVNVILRQRILDKTYAPGDRLPPESVLAQEFGVSRATVRSALARLDVEGLILRKQGDGTYVNEHLQEVNTHLGGLWEFTQLIESSGYRPAIKPLSASYRAATEREALALNLEPESEVLSLDRLFLADERRVIYAQNVLSAALLQNARDDIDASLNIRDFMKTYCNRDIAYAISQICAVLPDDAVRKILNRRAGLPLLQLYITFYDRENAPLLSGVSYLDDSALNLRLVQAWG